MRFTKLYILKYWKRLLIPLVSMLITLGIDTAFPYLQKIFVDDVILDGQTSFLTFFFGLFLTLVIVSAVGGYLKEYLFDTFALSVAKDLRRDIFKKVETMEFSFFDKQSTGELMSRMGEDVDSVWETLGFGLRLCIEMIIMFVLTAFIMIRMNALLAVVCLLILVPVSIMGWVFEKKFWDVYTQISDQMAQMNTVAQENLAGIRLVKAFAREKHEMMKFFSSNEDLYNLNLSQSKLVSRFMPVVECLTQFSQIVLIVFGGILCMRGNLSLGTLLAFSGYILNLSWCVKNIGTFITMLSQNKASMNRIFGILDEQPKITSPENAYSPHTVKGDICFKDVCFSYHDTEILKDINLFIPAGSSVALMGPTGCGKSTLLALIGRYYDVTSGEILVDGVNVKEWSLECLRNHMATVFQDVFLFSDSIYNNINFGETKTMEEVREAASLSSSLDFITEQEEGFDTIIGERGVGLSGGQKQRLTIARALVQNAPLLILDDATSALDMETEYTVLKNIFTRQKRATTFIVAHRISGVKDASMILYMEKGEILEQGTHQSLLARKGYYYHIYCDQFKDLIPLQEVSSHA
jgi:ATP-binding cassette subfamily B protein